MSTDSDRRAFLQRAAHLGLAGAAAPWALNLAALTEAAAQSSSSTGNGASDYKALVCVFLYGGNDYANTLVPYDEASHAAYARIRTGIALERADLHATALNPQRGLPDGRQMALAPSLAPLKSLFDAGRMGVLLNIGPLIQPITKAQYTAGNVPLPPKLFSHNDQQSFWQSSNPEGATSGWGGRMGDLFQSSNGQATFTCVNASGNAVFMSGREVFPYQVSPTGSVPIRGLSAPLFGSQACSDALRQIITGSHSHLMRAEYTRLTQRAIAAQATLSDALAAAPPLATAFPTGTLGAQLAIVARMMAARKALGARRQVFFVSLGGFDLHDFLLANHPGLLSQVAAGLKALHDATEELGIAAQVTSFTASDFGRTLSSNGDGSDHGWGSHHFLVGGAVQGGQFHGRLPEVAINGPDDVGQGRLLPTMAVDQLAATLARWMGVTPSDLPLVVPNLGNYSQPTLDLLRA